MERKVSKFEFLCSVLKATQAWISYILLNLNFFITINIVDIDSLVVKIKLYNGRWSL